MKNLQEKIESINAQYRKELLDRDLMKTSTINCELCNMISKEIDFMENYQIIPNFVDNMLNTFDIAVYYKQNGVLQKFGIFIFNKY